MSFDGQGPEDVDFMHRKNYRGNKDFFTAIGVDEQAYLGITCGEIRNAVRAALQNGRIKTTNVPSCLYDALSLVSPTGKWKDALHQ